MRPHLYLRAYMAGIVVPTLLLLVSMTVFAFFRFYFEVPSQFVLAMAAGAGNRISDGYRSECMGSVEHALPGASSPFALVAGTARRVATAPPDSGRSGAGAGIRRLRDSNAVCVTNHSDRHGTVLPGREVPSRISQRRNGSRLDQLLISRASSTGRRNSSSKSTRGSLKT